MKVRDLCLIVTGATITVVVIALAAGFFNPTKAQAQAAAAAPGVTALTLSTYGPVLVSASVQTGGGLITINDSVNRKVTIVAYESTIVTGGTTTPIVTLSTPNSFTY